MRKALLFALLSLFVCNAVRAQQPMADFTYTTSFIYCASVPAKVSFTNTSTTGVPQYPFYSVQWDFGDGTTADGMNVTTIDHTYNHPGNYVVTLTVKDTTGTSTVSKIITITNSFSFNYAATSLSPLACNKTAELFTTQVTGLSTGDSLSYYWQITHQDEVNSRTISTDSFVHDTFPTPQRLFVYLRATSKFGISCSDVDTFTITPPSPILPSNGERKLTANRQCTGDDGWVQYFYDNNTPNDETDDSLVLSLQSNGNNIGTIGDGTLSVSIAATAGAGSNTGILLTNPLISNSSGFWVMNRYWQVTPTHQPVTPVGVRFYFNDQDVADVNGSYPSHNLNIGNLIFYKTHGGNPDPTTNLAGAEYITSIKYSFSPDTTHWKDFGYSPYYLDKHMAEFQVASFSGGGGGATGNGQVLPVQLTSFNAVNNGNKVSLQWTTAQEINVSKYNVQVSTDGRQFTTLGTVAAHGKTAPDAYAFTYNETQKAQAYYRLQIVEKNGTASGSNVVFLSFAKANHIVLYPNPAKNTVQVKAPGFENKWVTADVYNTAGVKVSTASLYFSAGTATLNTSALASGHYNIALRDEQSVTHVPLVIVK